MNLLSLGALLVVLNIARKLYTIFHVHSALRHFPRVPLTTTLKNILYSVSYEDQWRNDFRDAYKTGKYVVAHAFNAWELHVCDVEAAKYITTNYNQFHHMNSDNFGIRHGLMDCFMGDNLVVADGEIWHKQRPIINKAFNGLKPTVGAAEAVMHMIGNLSKANECVDIAPFMRRAMFRSLLNVIFDLPELTTGERDEEISAMLATIFKAGLHPLYLIFNFMDRPWNPLRRNDFEIQQELDVLIRSIIEQKRQELDTEKDLGGNRDLITLILNANRDPDNQKMTDKEIVDNVKTLFLAGYETASTAMSFVFQLLAIHRDVQDKVREEVFRVLGSKPGDMVTPTPDQQRQLEYLNAVVREGNRLYAPAGQFNNRYTAQDVTLPDGTFLPKGITLTVDQWAMLRSDKIWKDPETFRPERHLGDDREGRTNVEHIVFGAGKRICPGMNFANTEQRVMLALCVQKFRWELADPEDGKHIKTSSHWVVRPMNANLRIHFL
jgi:cytochrome P450